MTNKIRLRPVSYTTNTRKIGSRDDTKQMFLLKALKVTNDPKQLRDMLGVKTVAEVYRTLDKLAMRKEYHAALNRSGVSFEFIVDGLKAEAMGEGKSADRIKALTVLLKSLGLDKYDSDAASGGSWEEELVKSLDRDKAKELDSPQIIEAEYEVNTPETPEAMKKMREEENKLLSGIYE